MPQVTEGQILCRFLPAGMAAAYADPAPTSNRFTRLFWPSMTVNDTLADALTRHRLELPANQVEQLEKYCQLLWDWNAKLNLTRHTDFEKFVGRDLVDSLQLAAHLREGEEVLDVGTGGGVPGVVLAIVRPDLKMALCDSVGKKARAVESIVKDLGLEIPVYPSAPKSCSKTRATMPS